MRKNSLLTFVLAATTVIFMTTGCMKIVKQEEVQKAAELSPTAQPAEEKTSAGKAEGIKEEKVGEETIKQEAVLTEEAAKKESAAKAEAKDAAGEAAEKEGGLLTIYFDFDRFTIMDDMKPALDKNAQWLKKDNGVKIQIQGHADERGPSEYNIALGERRAQSIKKYLADRGVSEARLSTISYGEERPADPGHTEEAWAKNRRVEFAIVK